MNQEFSITFWITTEKNPAWKNPDSEINFPPFTVNNGVKVFFSKDKKNLKVHVLHPDIGFRKISANIERFIGNNVFIALTNTNVETNLYINADLKATINKDNLLKNIERGDYVMVNIENGDLQSVKISGDIKTIIIAKVKKVEGNEVVLNFFEENETAKLPISRLVY